MAIVTALVLATVLATSVLSGIVGMAGGMILVATLVALLPVPTAMLLHGVTQGVANGSRALFLRPHIRWQVLPPYVLGAGLCLGLFAVVAVVPDSGLVLLLVGLFPWVGRLLPRLGGLDVEHPATALACGFLVTAAQLLAGASGPLLDVFFLRSPLTRHQIVATKAVTQTLGHLVKLGYYGALLIRTGDTVAAPPWLFLAVVPVALAGTRIGTGILDRLDDAFFRRASERLILAVGLACSIAGVLELLSG